MRARHCRKIFSIMAIFFPIGVFAVTNPPSTQPSASASGAQVTISPSASQLIKTKTFFDHSDYASLDQIENMQSQLDFGNAGASQ